MKKTLAILLSLALLLGMVGVSAAEEEWITLKVETYDREIAGLDVTNCWQLKYAQEHFGDPNHIKLEFVSFARWTEGDLLTIEGHSLESRILNGTLLKGGEYTSFHDHRMAMALTVASLGADGPIIIDDTDCVAKSFPAFFDTWRQGFPSA